MADKESEKEAFTYTVNADPGHQQSVIMCRNHVFGLYRGEGACGDRFCHCFIAFNRFTGCFDPGNSNINQSPGSPVR